MYTTILDIAHGIIQIGGALLLIILLFISLRIFAVIMKANRAVRRVNTIIEKAENRVSYPMAALLSYATNQMNQSDGCGGCADKSSRCG